MSADGATTRIGLLKPLDAWAFVDALGPNATGEIIISAADGPRGAVFVEAGRVCWSAARGLARRLTELLGVRAQLSPSSMEELYYQCKQRGVPLGEYLVERGVLRSDDLREALLLHTLESLGALCAADAQATFRPRSGRGYNPRFTFGTAELLARAGASAHGAIAAAVQPMLASLFDPDDWAAAFVRTGASAFPEPIALHGRAPNAIAPVLRLGKWAASALDSIGAFTRGFALLAVDRAGARSFVAFRHGTAVVGGETSALGPARILNRRARATRARGDGHADL